MFTRPKHDFTHLGWADGWECRILDHWITVPPDILAYDSTRAAAGTIHTINLLIFLVVSWAIYDILYISIAHMTLYIWNEELKWWNSELL